MVSIKEKIKEFRSDAQTLDKNLQGEGGGKFTGGGGTKGFGQHAIADAEIFHWKTNSWSNAACMLSGRFGHAVVTVGGKVFAVGGDERNPSNIT